MAITILSLPIELIFDSTKTVRENGLFSGLILVAARNVFDSFVFAVFYHFLLRGRKDDT